MLGKPSAVIPCAVWNAMMAPRITVGRSDPEAQRPFSGGGVFSYRHSKVPSGGSTAALS